MVKLRIAVARGNLLFPRFLEPHEFLLVKSFLVFFPEPAIELNKATVMVSNKLSLNPFNSSKQPLLSRFDVTEHFPIPLHEGSGYLLCNQIKAAVIVPGSANNLLIIWVSHPHSLEFKLHMLLDSLHPFKLDE